MLKSFDALMVIMFNFDAFDRRRTMEMEEKPLNDVYKNHLEKMTCWKLQKPATAGKISTGGATSKNTTKVGLFINNQYFGLFTAVCQ